MFFANHRGSINIVLLLSASIVVTGLVSSFQLFYIQQAKVDARKSQVAFLNDLKEKIYLVLMSRQACTLNFQGRSFTAVTGTGFENSELTALHFPDPADSSSKGSTLSSQGATVGSYTVDKFALWKLAPVAPGSNGFRGELAIVAKLTKGDDEYGVTIPAYLAVDATGAISGCSLTTMTDTRKTIEDIICAEADPSKPTYDPSIFTCVANRPIITGPV